MLDYIFKGTEIRCILTNCIPDIEFSSFVYKLAFKHADLVSTKLALPDFFFFFWMK